MKKTIGYTTGVFDLFHVGHLNIIKKAASKCDYLIVGVTACETVKEYKGRYPIVPLINRMEIIKALKYVDKVVVQKDMDKLKAWENLKFNVLFHGSDWKNTDMYIKIEEELKKRNVEITYFEYTKGTSTTQLKKEIYESFSETKNT